MITEKKKDTRRYELSHICNVRGVAVVIVLVAFVMPSFSALYASFGSNLPRWQR